MSDANKKKWILTNISWDVDGRVYAGMPSFFSSEADAIENARKNLAEDFNIGINDVEYEAQENESPIHVISMSRDGRFEAYTIARIS